MKSFLSIITLSLGLTFFIISCGGDEPMEMFTDNFDREAMLIDWADQIIIPAFESYNATLDELVNAKDVFITDQNELNLTALRDAYISAYLSWQNVTIYDIGKAEEIGLRNFTNIFPTDVDGINENIIEQNYNLDLPSNFDKQGFPALDYLLFGTADDTEGILLELSDDNTSVYLDDLVTRLQLLSREVLEDWNGGFRSSFIANNGSSATASVDKLVNDFLFYYEKFFRAGKLGIPAGVFSGNTLPLSVEAPYSQIYTKSLFFEAFNAVQAFFVGQSFDGQQQGMSLQSYLTFISNENQTVDIASIITDQWTVADNSAALLSDSFREQVEVDNDLMLNAYDEIQRTVPTLKVDMLQALNIQVDFVDADGD